MVAAVIAEPTPGYLRAGILAPVSGLGVGVLLFMAHSELPHCAAIALAMPGYVLLLFFQRYALCGMR